MMVHSSYDKEAQAGNELFNSILSIPTDSVLSQAVLAGVDDVRTLAATLLNNGADAVLVEVRVPSGVILTHWRARVKASSHH